MQYGLLYLTVQTHGFTVPAMLDTGAMQSFVSHKLAAKLLITIQTTMLWTIVLLTGKTMVTTLAIQLDIFIDNFIYT